MITKQATEALRKEGLLSKEVFQELKEYEKLNKGNVLDFCAENNIAPTSQMVSILQKNYSLPIVDLAQIEIDLKIAQLLPASICFEHMLIPFHEDENYLYVAMSNPKNGELLNFIENKVGKKVAVYLANQNDIKLALEVTFNNSAEDAKKIILELIERAHKVTHTPETMAKEVPLISLLNQLIVFGVRRGASDMHIEPREDNVSIRYRIDGILYELFTLPRDLLAPIIARIKIVSKLRIDEHMRPQDGRFTFQESEFKIAVRLSIVPTLHGQKASLRFLDTTNKQISLNSLGLSEMHRRTLIGILGISNGIILVTGPTGSGKTTTLYAMVKEIAHSKVNISTIEDPIEYNLKGANQIQVNPQVGLDFAAGLRSILRQDPDIIMVGEIRDKETATIAINAALTGHLVLSSLHTNSAAAAIPRLLDMGVEPFLVASTLRAVISQRLVRNICPNCKTEFAAKNLPKSFIDHYNKNETPVIAKGKGCTECLNTGYQGRSGIFEIMPVEEKMHDLIMQRANTTQIENEAKKNNMKTIVEDGLIKVLKKDTTLEEITRVIK